MIRDEGDFVIKYAIEASKRERVTSLKRQKTCSLCKRVFKKSKVVRSGQIVINVHQYFILVDFRTELCKDCEQLFFKKQGVKND